MSQLYLASAVLKYYHDCKKPLEDVDNVVWALQQCLYKIQIACDELLYNFPNPILGKVLSWIVFPWGRAYRKPKDKLSKDIVAPMLIPSELRNRLTTYCYLSHETDDIGHRLDKALEQITMIDPISKKLHKAIQSGAIPQRLNFTERVEKAQQLGILTAEESNMINEFEALKNEIIKVNEFSHDLNEVIA